LSERSFGIDLAKPGHKILFKLRTLLLIDMPSFLACEIFFGKLSWIFFDKLLQNFLDKCVQNFFASLFKIF